MENVFYTQCLSIANEYIARLSAAGNDITSSVAETAAKQAAENQDLIDNPNDLKTTWTVENYVREAAGLN